MSSLGMILNYVGGLVALVGGIWLLVLAFKESLVWGLVCFFCPIVSLYFAITRWEKAKKPFLIEVGGIVAAAIGNGLMLAG